MLIALFKLSEKRFKKKLAKLKKENVQKEYEIILDKEKNKYKKKFKIETSKILAIYLFVLLNVVILYAMKAMWIFGDLSYLGVLITDIAAQVLIYMIYCMKAYHGKKQEEHTKLEREKLANSASETQSIDFECEEEDIFIDEM